MSKAFCKKHGETLVMQYHVTMRDGTKHSSKKFCALCLIEWANETFEEVEIREEPDKQGAEDA